MFRHSAGCGIRLSPPCTDIRDVFPNWGSAPACLTDSGVIFGLRVVPRDVPGHTSAHPTITDHGPRRCLLRLFPPRPGIKAVSGSEMPLSDRSQDMFIEERRPLAARLRTTQRALGTGELRRRQLLLPSAATDGPMAPPSLPTRGRIQRSDAVNVLRQDVQPMGYQPGHPRSWSLASIDQSQSFP